MKNPDVKNAVLKILKNNSHGFTSGEHMSGLFGLTRAALWKHIERLRGEGFVIESSPRKGYRLKDGPDRITDEDIREGLPTNIIGAGEIHCYTSVTSTNEVACTFAENGAPEGGLVISETQTRGRGRMGRSWVSPPGVGLYFSIILRPEMKIDEIPSMTLVASGAIVEALRSTAGVHPSVKWPNDVFIGGKKVCGVLTETRGHSDRTDFIVLGIGINVNTEAGKLPEQATSIKAETGRDTDRVLLLRSVLQRIESSYDIFRKEGFEVFRRGLKDMSNMLGKTISTENNRKAVFGKAVDIDERGALVVKDASGKMHRIFSGDVELCAPKRS
jgi:BirA family transcriptional regulator, biotin operon repressor / biotin---[acetyl-CoA-carboxylase] ligase